jgi:hypothetical protein
MVNGPPWYETFLVWVDQAVHERTKSICQHTREHFYLHWHQCDGTVIAWVSSIPFFE